MAASITTAGTTLEAQVFEVCSALQIAEDAATAANPDNPQNRVQITPDLDNGEVTIVIQLPLIVTRTGASLSISVDDYLS